jgi:hypothetical protein
MALSPDPLHTPYLDPAFVARVVSIPDPLERNTAITRGYHDLSEAVTALLGREHANWLTFGQWASAEARESIDGSAVPAVVRPFFGHEIRAAVAAGNAAIFGDVAPMFARFVRLFAAASGRPSGEAEVESARAARAALLADPLIAREEDLVRAFAAYADAFDLLAAGDPDPGRRAQRMLVANASIGAHEQRVADPYVRAAIPGRWISAIVATSHMGLKVPEGMLQLQRDVPRPAYLEGAQFPPHLVHLDDPEACALATRFHQDPDTVADSDAPDWESYDERMGFIYTLLRVYQGDPALFPLPPGTADGPPGLDTA